MSLIMKIVFVTFLVAIVFSSSAFSLKFLDCGSSLANITSISVSNCNKAPCTFRRGTKVNVSISFVPKVEITKTKIHVWGVMKLFKIPFPLPNADGCKNSGLTCPLKPNVPVVYNVQLDVKEVYPKISLIAKWEMTDDDIKNRPVFCFEIGVRLV